MTRKKQVKKKRFVKVVKYTGDWKMMWIISITLVACIIFLEWLFMMFGISPTKDFGLLFLVPVVIAATLAFAEFMVREVYYEEM